MFSIIKNFFGNNLYALSLYARQIAGTIILFIIARYLSIYDFGLFSSYKNIAVFWLMFANLGYGEYILVSSKSNTTEVKLKISLFILNAISIAILIILFSLIFHIQSHFLFILIVIRTFFDGIFFSLILPYFQSSRKFNTIAIINIIYAVCITFIAIISFIFKLSLIKFLLLNILLGCINFIQCSYFAKTNYLLALYHINKFFKLIDKSIFAYIGVRLAYFLYYQISSLYVATYLKKEEAALYFSAFTIAGIVNLLIDAQAQKMVPEMIKSNIETIKRIINKNLTYILAITIIFFFFLVIFGKWLLLLLYGQTYYANAHIHLLILMLGNICSAVASMYGTYITASGNQKKKIPIQLQTTVLTVMSLFVLHRFGIFSATISFFLASLFIAIRYTIYTQNLIKQNNIKENK